MHMARERKRMTERGRIELEVISLSDVFLSKCIQGRERGALRGEGESLRYGNLK